MSEAMTLTQLGEVIKHARQHNSPFSPRASCPTVKYIDPHIDNRDGRCFSIVFRGFGTEQPFGIAVIAVIGTIIYVAAHFIAKFW